MLNEPEWVYQGAPRRLHFSVGAWLVDGLKPTPARDLPGNWVNVDDCWGFAAAGVEGWHYDASSKIVRGRREQLLCWPAPAQLEFAKDEVIAQRVLVVGLNETAAATAARAQRLAAQANVSGTAWLCKSMAGSCTWISRRRCRWPASPRTPREVVYQCRAKLHTCTSVQWKPAAGCLQHTAARVEW